MTLNISREISALQRMTPKELRAKYAEVFGESTKSGNKVHLVKRIAWRIQSLEDGGLSDRARRRADELARDADIRLSPPQDNELKKAGKKIAEELSVSNRDTRIPQPGTVITREYKSEQIQITVREHGFEYQGVVFRSLSAVAKLITGSHINGFEFFKLGKRGKKS